MKAGAHETIKFKRLQRRLKLPLWQAIGLLESLWQVTARCAPRGDIGKHANEDIAAWLEYADDENELISALVDCGWLDECSSHRLIVHDWHEHAPNYVKGNVARHLGGFVTDFKDIPRGRSPGDNKTEHPQGTVPPSLAKPSQVKRRQEKAIARATDGVNIPDCLNESRFLDAWERFKDYYQEAPENHSGRAMPFQTQTSNLMELSRRFSNGGLERCIADLELSIRVSKVGNLQDSTQMKAKPGNGQPAKPKILSVEEERKNYAGVTHGQE